MTRAEKAARYAALGDEQRLRLVDELFLSDRTPAELAELLGMRSNLLAHHLAVLETAGIVRRRPSEGDRRRRYVSLVVDHLPEPAELPRIGGDSVLFVCRQNSARSQLAAAMFGRRARRVGSAGMSPADRVHPLAVRVAAEVGLELTDPPRGYDAVETPDVVVSVCDVAGEEPPPFPESLRLHWSIPDPVRSGRVSDFRAARVELSRRTALLARAMA